MSNVVKSLFTISRILSQQKSWSLTFRNETLPITVWEFCEALRSRQKGESALADESPVCRN